MSGVNGQQFGHFTYKNRDYDLKQFDVNENGKLEKTEVDALLERIAQETGEDILELSNIVNSHDINKDGNLDINKMNRWQIEDGINAKVSAFDATISADFIGDLAQYQSRARADIRAFAQQFINDAVNNMANGNVNLQTIASQFETELNTQYTTVIKPEYERLCNEANQEKLISNITDNVIESLLANVSSGHKTEITERMTAYAQLIIKQYPINGDVELKDWLMDKLTEFVNNPVKLLSKLIVDLDLGEKSEYDSVCTDEEFTKLTNAVKDIIELANTIGIVFINSENGKAMTAATIIAKYNKENAGDLYDLIMNMKTTFAGDNTSIAGITINNTKGKLYYAVEVGESKISKPTFDNTNPNDGTNIPTGKTAFNSLANARDRIRISLKPILERRAKDLCESYGIPESQWKNVFETIFEEELRSAVDNNWEWDSFLHLCYLVHCRPAANDTREGVVKRMSNWVEQWLQDNN